MIRNNDDFYLQEAFKGLTELNEEAFPIEDEDKVDELVSFVKDDIDPEEEEEIDVIDPEAKDENDLQDTYVGKAILECNCCHTRIYKDLKEVFLDEETGFANADEECPVCNQTDGFTVIGKIEEFDPEEDFAEKEDDEEENPDDIDLEDEIEDEEESEFSDEEVEEAFDFVKNGEKLGEGCHDKEESEEDDKEDLDEGMKNAGYDSQRDKDIDDALDAMSDEERAELDKISAKAESLEGSKVASEDSKALDESNENLGVSDEASVKDDKSLEDDQKDLTHCPCENIPAINEGISIDMNTKQVNADTADDIKIDVNAGTVEVGAGAGEEMIAPLDDADMSEIEANVPEDELGAPEDLVGDEVVNDAELDAAKDDFTPPADIDADVEDDLGLDGAGEDAEVEADEEEPEDVEEESFNVLGESFMRRVYENVKSFKLDNVNKTNECLEIDGTITFESGKSKPTKFVFENAKTSKKGKTILEGMNTTFSTAKKTFTVKGSLVENKLVCERLVYNYKVDTLNESNENEVIRVYGVCKA